MSVLLDTGFIFAYLNADDKHHAQAKGIAEKIASGTWGTPLVTELVVGEVLSLARARTGSAILERSARVLLPLPTPAMRGLLLAPSGGELLVSAYAAFEKYRDQRLSFVDAHLLASFEELGAQCLATFDRRLAHLAPVAD